MVKARRHTKSDPFLSKPISRPYCHYTITRDVLDELEAKKDKIEETHEDDMVTIDGVQVHLSTFNKGLMEIANPSELGSIFSKQINNAKKRSSSELEKESSESEAVKKAKS
ncbi:AIF_HP2_G0023240.mRNA.1.CDS.1 [Saccharomyces cerevisiae]|nr:AIF_HP2_G0023240.mRNA.1.CDS.1 [Saccharomyces cerevisiae]CAI6545062.1 AIF_HP2_G0023240.mRNA.1.CDS.1 [Saccharomyces cerevisiae]